MRVERSDSDRSTVRVRLFIPLLPVELRRAVLLLGLLFALDNPALAQARWTVDPAAPLSISSSGSDGVPLFGSATGATMLPDGRLALSDGANGTVVFFAPDGKLLSRVGRKGQGPQEFIRPGWIGRCGSDTLFVWDEMGASLSALLPEAGIVQRRLVPGTRSQRDVGCSTATRFLIPTSSVPVPGPAKGTGVTRTGVPYELRWGQYDIVVRDREGGVVFELPHVPHGEFVVGRILPGDRPNNFDRPLGGRLYLTSMPTGFAHARSDSGVVHVRGLNGEPLKSFTIPRASEPLSRAEYESAVAAETAQLPTGLRPYFEPFALAMEPPRTRPSINGLRGDATGLLWVQRSLPGAAPTEFSVFTVSGEERARVSLEEAVLVFEIGEDYILGRVESDEREESVRLWRYSRSLRAARPISALRSSTACGTPPLTAPRTSAACTEIKQE